MRDTGRPTDQTMLPLRYSAAGALLGSCAGLAEGVVLPLLSHRALFPHGPGLLLLFAALGAVVGLVDAFAGARDRQKLYRTVIALEELVPLERERAGFAGIAYSSDGRARVRCLSQDLERQHVGPHVHYEVFDSEAALIRTGYIALLHGRGAAKERPIARFVIAADPAHPSEGATFWWGLPSGPGSRPVQLPEAAVVVREEWADGVLLTRLDRRGRYAGDTWHADRAEADRQLTFEFPGLESAGWARLPKGVRNPVRFALRRTAGSQ